MTSMVRRGWVYGLALLAVTITACGTRRAHSGFQNSAIVQPQADGGTSVSPGPGSDGGTTASDDSGLPTLLSAPTMPPSAPTRGCGHAATTTRAAGGSLGQTQKCYVGRGLPGRRGHLHLGDADVHRGRGVRRLGSVHRLRRADPTACDGIDHACNGAANQGCTCTRTPPRAATAGPPAPRESASARAERRPA